jgi:cytochrome c peroxidase
VFDGKAQCASCHSGPAYTDVRDRLHDAAETGMDPRHAARSATGKYRTTPLRALLDHAPYFHDGSAATLADVVSHYDQALSLGLSASEQSDLAAYLGSL